MKIRVKLFDGVAGWVYLVLATITAMVGHTIHGSLLWSIIDFIFWPIAWIKWLICHQVCLTVIKNAFGFLMQ